MFKRHRFKQQVSLQERLAAFANVTREKAANEGPGSERDKLLKSARQADIAMHLEYWLSSPGLRPPE